MGVIRGWLETECLRCQRKLVGVRFRTRGGGSLRSVSLSSEIPCLRIWQVLEVCMGPRRRKSKPSRVSSYKDAACELGSGWEWKVFQGCIQTLLPKHLIFFSQYCTECLVGGSLIWPQCSCQCISMFKSSLTRIEGLTKLTEKSKLKLAVRQCRRSCNSAWLRKWQMKFRIDKCKKMHMKKTN